MLFNLKFLFFCFILAYNIQFTNCLKAQSLTGTTGLVTIPTARMQKDGTLSIGLSYFDRKNQEYFEGLMNFGSIYVNLTFLPFLELVVRVNRPFPFHSKYTVDRTPMIKLRILNEKKFLPAIALGINDFASTANWATIHFNATYIILSKKINDFDFHFGFAPTIMKARYYQLNGPFGGVAYEKNNFFKLYGEYDTRNINAGIQLLILKHFGINLATINFNSFAAGVNYKIFLL